jgi:O-acetyl-ADP-ribose deacetylase
MSGFVPQPDLLAGGVMKTILPIIIEGDLLDQPVEVIVNAWNRNIIPWWLLLPHGVSGAIKKRGGYKPFIELSKNGPIPLGGAVLTTAGKLNYRGIIHVAGIDMLWRATTDSIMMSVASAMEIVNAQSFESIAFPIIGAGTGGFGEEKALLLMQEAIQEIESSAKVLFVKFRKSSTNR